MSAHLSFVILGDIKQKISSISHYAKMTLLGDVEEDERIEDDECIEDDNRPKKKKRQSLSKKVLIQQLEDQERDMKQQEDNRKEVAKEFQRAHDEMLGEVLQSVDDMKKNFSTITGQGYNDYSLSRQVNDDKYEAAKEKLRSNEVLRASKEKLRSSSTLPRPLPTRRSYKQNKEGKRIFAKTSTPRRDPPTDGKEYTPASVIRNILRFPKVLHSSIMDSMITNKEVPVKKRQLQRMIKNSRDGNTVLPGWGLRGRPPIMRFGEFQDAMTEAIEEHGEALATDQTFIRNTLVNGANENRRNVVQKVSITTLNRFNRYVKGLLPGMKKTRTKTMTRVVAESSLMCVCALLHTIASTHYRIDTRRGGSGDKRYKSCTTGVKSLYDWVSKYYDDAPLICANPELITSTDDSALFACRTKVSNYSNAAPLMYVYATDDSTLCAY